MISFFFSFFPDEFSSSFHTLFLNEVNLKIDFQQILHINGVKLSVKGGIYESIKLHVKFEISNALFNFPGD